MTIGPVSGDLVGIYIGGVMIGCATGATFSTSTNTETVACKEDEGYEDHALTTQNWNISGSGVVKFDATYGMKDILAAKKARTPITVKMSTEVAGDTFISGTASITEFEWAAETGSPSTYSYTFLGKGEYIVGTVPAAV